MIPQARSDAYRLVAAWHTRQARVEASINRRR